jgi:large subunit ribosomal protein L32e
MSIDQLMKIRKILKKKRPVFRREDCNKLKSVSPSWRRPTGTHSKVRHQLKGRVLRIKTGYRSPAEIRGSHKSGLFPALVFAVADLEKLDKVSQGAVIASGVGLKNKVLVLQKAKQLGIRVLNVKNSDEFIKDIEDMFRKRKEEKKARETKKESKDAEKKENAAVKKRPALAEKVEGEEKKVQEKKELDRELSRRQR